jgi:hypothetical protein
MPAATTRSGKTVTATRAILLSAARAGLTGVPPGAFWDLVASSIQSWWHQLVWFRQSMTAIGHNGAQQPAARGTSAITSTWGRTTAV